MLIVQERKRRLHIFSFLENLDGSNAYLQELNTVTSEASPAMSSERHAIRVYLHTSRAHGVERPCIVCLRLVSHVLLDKFGCLPLKRIKHISPPTGSI